VHGSSEVSYSGGSALERQALVSAHGVLFRKTTGGVACLMEMPWLIAFLDLEVSLETHEHLSDLESSTATMAWHSTQDSLRA
jgi:hypothetical protein